MFINPVSTIAIFLAIHGCLAAPVQGNERALVARDKGSPKPATVAKPAVLPAAKKEPPSTPAADTKSRPAVNKVEEPPKSAAENKPKPAAPAANKEQPKAAAAKSKSCALHKKRSWIYRRDGSDSECESDGLPESDDNTLHLHAIVDKHGNLDTSKVHTFQLGRTLGSGQDGSVRKITSHGFDTDIPQVVKTPNIGGGPAMEEAKNLKKVGQFTMVGKDSNGATHIVMDQVPGKHLKNTNAYKNAKTEQDRAQVKAQATQLTGEDRLYHAEAHNVLHNDVHPGNVKFTEDQHGNLEEARLLDWGRATPVKGSQLSQEDKDDIQNVNVHW